MPLCCLAVLSLTGTCKIKVWFWRCVREEMDDTTRSKLLAFWSGSPFPPMFGFNPAMNDPDVRHRVQAGFAFQCRAVRGVQLVQPQA